MKLEDIKGLIRIRNEKSKKNRQHNDRKEKQRSTKHTHKTKDRVTRTQLKAGVNSDATGGYTVPAPLVAPVVIHICRF